MKGGVSRGLRMARQPIRLLLGVVAAASMAYSTEQWALLGHRGLLDSLPLIAAGILAALWLAFITFRRVLVAREFGPHLHLAPLLPRYDRSRHEQEHALLYRDLQRQADHAVLTGLIAPRLAVDDPNWQWESTVADMVKDAVDSYRLGRTGLPRAPGLSVLVGGDHATVFAVGMHLGVLLPTDSLQLLVDKIDDEEEAFIRINIDADVPSKPGTDDVFVFDLVHKEKEAREEAKAYIPEAMSAKFVGTPSRLDEQPDTYREHIEELADAANTTGELTVGFAGPAGVAFALGWIVGTRQRAGKGPSVVRALSYEKAGNNATGTYVANPAIQMAGTNSIEFPDQVVLGRWWTVNLIACSFLAAVCGTAGIGNVATLLEWLLTSSNESVPLAGWFWLLVGGIGLPLLIAWGATLTMRRTVTAPEFIVSEFPFNGRSRLGQRIVPPVHQFRTPLVGIADAFPDSRVIVDLAHMQDHRVKEVAQFLSKGWRGSLTPMVQDDGERARITDDPKSSRGRVRLALDTAESGVSSRSL